MTLQCHTISYHHIIHTSPIAFATIIPYHTCLPDSATFFQCPQNDERYPPVIWHSFDIAVESHPCVDDLPIIIIGYNWWCSIVQYLCQILRGYFSPNSTAVFFVVLSLARAGHGCWASSIDAQVLPSLSRLMKSGIGKGNVVEERRGFCGKVGS